MLFMWNSETSETTGPNCNELSIEPSIRSICVDENSLCTSVSDVGEDVLK